MIYYKIKLINQGDLTSRPVQEFLNDLENELNHIDSIHTSIDDVCIEETTK